MYFLGLNINYLKISLLNKMVLPLIPVISLLVRVFTVPVIRSVKAVAKSEYTGTSLL